MARKSALLALLLAPVAADKHEDLITSLPGFEHLKWPFKAYSGLLHVPGPINGYDALSIHYQFHTSQHQPAKDPVVAWHNGGPGSSSILLGLYGEMGAFQVGEKGYYLNPYAWNRVANMLYLESPAGSGDKAGYSTCIKDGKAVPCNWNDVTQAEAYSHTLMAFFEAFPEFSANGLYLVGESYFGQYGPNIAHYILNHEPFNSKLGLKGIALGNACFGGTETCVRCNGPSQDKVNVDLFFGHGLFSPKLYKQIYASCKFPENYDNCQDDSHPDDLSTECRQLLTEMSRQVGPFDIYNLYNNCPATQAMLQRTGKSMSWLLHFLRSHLHDRHTAHAELTQMNGGYDWDCDGNASSWITRPDVRKALHLESVEPGASAFSYVTSGPASVTLYPKLVGKLRILIYSGDADACVPYTGAEGWIDELEDQGLLERTKAWTPWFANNTRTPAGAVTRYSVPGAPGMDFSFQTVRLAGHMVPQFRPEPGFVMFSRFLAGESETTEASEPAQIVV